MAGEPASTTIESARSAQAAASADTRAASSVDVPPGNHAPEQQPEIQPATPSSETSTTAAQAEVLENAVSPALEQPPAKTPFDALKDAATVDLSQVTPNASNTATADTKIPPDTHIGDGSEEVVVESGQSRIATEEDKVSASPQGASTIDQNGNPQKDMPDPQAQANAAKGPDARANGAGGPDQHSARGNGAATAESAQAKPVFPRGEVPEELQQQIRDGITIGNVTIRPATRLAGDSISAERAMQDGILNGFTELAKTPEGLIENMRQLKDIALQAGLSLAEIEAHLTALNVNTVAVFTSGDALPQVSPDALRPQDSDITVAAQTAPTVDATAAQQDATQASVEAVDIPSEITAEEIQQLEAIFAEGNMVHVLQELYKRGLTSKDMERLNNTLPAFITRLQALPGDRVQLALEGAINIMAGVPVQMVETRLALGEHRVNFGDAITTLMGQLQNPEARRDLQKRAVYIADGIQNFLVGQKLLPDEMAALTQAAGELQAALRHKKDYGALMILGAILFEMGRVMLSASGIAA